MRLLSTNVRIAALSVALAPSPPAVAQDAVNECASDKHNFSSRATRVAAGVTFAALEGDPNGSGYFVAQLTFAPGGRIASHWHPALKRITVQRGTLDLEVGSDTARTVRLGSGSTLAIPARTIHAEGSRDSSVVLICGMGPLMTHSMSPALQRSDTTLQLSDTLPAAVVDRFFARYNAHDIEGMRSLLAPAVVWATVTNDSLRTELRGREALIQYISASFARTPSTGSMRGVSVVVGPFVAFREDAYWESSSGRRVESALVVYEVRSGLIRSARYF